MATTHLILGGARSGKSKFAEQRSKQLSSANKQKIYLATAAPGDAEMLKRIEMHQQQRQADNWTVIEQQTDLASVLNNANKQQCVLIDCLTLWLSNCLHQQCWDEQRSVFLDALSQCQADVVMVSNEVGSGIVPMGQLSREFVDQSGCLHQELAALCDSVSLIVAGLELKLKA